MVWLIDDLENGVLVLKLFRKTTFINFHPKIDLNNKKRIFVNEWRFVSEGVNIYL